MNTPLSSEQTVPLSHWGLIRARGADAEKFLQGQLTNDVISLESSQARLAGFCSAKGRLQASFVVWKSAPDELMLACAASVLQATLKRLSMFVLRAQCKLSEAGTELRLAGTAGDEARALGADMPVWGKREGEEGTVIRLPDVKGVPRCMIVAALQAFEPTATATALDPWRLLEVESGIALIEAATADQFVPQMINYELIGGVDFRKGCYPGQEVVARSQYRGTAKRRMFLFASDALAVAGQEVFHSEDPSQPAGMVVNSAPRPGGDGSAALVVVKLSALERGELRLSGPEGQRLRQEKLAYLIPLEGSEPA